jgi:hypothetical protein
MLTIYVEPDKMPKDKKFIFDVDEFFGICKLRNDAFTNRVLTELEQARYCDKDTFCDRFNRVLYKNCLSTSSKILLATYYYPDMIFNAVELGSDGYELLLNIENGNVLFPDRLAKLCYTQIKDVVVDGHKCNDVTSANYALWGILIPEEEDEDA